MAWCGHPPAAIPASPALSARLLCTRLFRCPITPIAPPRCAPSAAAPSSGARNGKTCGSRCAIAPSVTGGAESRHRSLLIDPTRQPPSQSDRLKGKRLNVRTNHRDPKNHRQSDRAWSLRCFPVGILQEKGCSSNHPHTRKPGFHGAKPSKHPCPGCQNRQAQGRGEKAVRMSPPAKDKALGGMTPEGAAACRTFATDRLFQRPAATEDADKPVVVQLPKQQRLGSIPRRPAAAWPAALARAEPMGVSLRRTACRRWD